ncbi:hypothetical protein [Marinactinospora rubrisoli]|uniref:Uncharacterized protein n=1 Tax=Marinactinospora rubrisoli TaxID=2715399 RepID=A0ABW2KM54_9ACTN
MKIRDRAVHTAHELRDKVKEAADRARHAAESGTERAGGKEKGERAEHGVLDTLARRYGDWKRARREH